MKIKNTGAFHFAGRRTIQWLTACVSLFLINGTIHSQSTGKKMAGHQDFDSWEKVTNHSISPNGEWSCYSVNPQEGDGTLTFYNIKTGKKIDLPRGYRPSFTADSRWGVALIKPYYRETRQARIDGKKDFDMPQDSLAIIDLSKGIIDYRSEVVSYKTGKEGGTWIAWQTCDTTYIDKDLLSNREAGKPVLLENLQTGVCKKIDRVTEYNFSENGERLAFKTGKNENDSSAFSGIGIVALPDTTERIIDSGKFFYGSPVLDRKGSRIAYTASEDSVESGTRICSLYLAEIMQQPENPREIKIQLPKSSSPHFAKPHSKDKGELQELEKEWKEKTGSDEDLYINQYSVPEFSHNGNRLIIGIAPAIAPNDTTLVDFEKASLDIWRWDAPLIPPMENLMVDELREKTFPVVIDLATGSQVLLNKLPFAEVTEPDRWDGDWALIADPSEHLVSQQWDYQYPVDLSVKNVLTGEVKKVATVKNDYYDLSPSGKFVLWFSDRQYHCFDISTGKIADISNGVPYPLWEEDQDLPLPEKEPYGIMGWSKDDREVLVYDRFDSWALDPTGQKEPYCFTGGEGRLKNMRLRAIEAQPDFRFFENGNQILYDLFDFTSKKNGFATSLFENSSRLPKVDILDGFTFYQVRKAKDKNIYSWVQGNFETSPELYVAQDLGKKKWTRVTDTNEQMKDYSWGTAELMKWYAYDGKPAEGILYLPEDFDENKSYPMLVYFYETLSELLYHHFQFEPSWSWINIPFFVSRGYVVFLPDVHYNIGLPGESAYNYICSGVEEVCRKYSNIDSSRIGIDGQSWGGYQAAYLLTRTNMFACAGAGAPVANMTSAFGGIRWGSGDSRQAQYEMGQSRIGRNLWEAPQLYIANSPLFYADRIETPLLIMHNDEDGAVPWYQGIELFMALRRLGKPVWMLQYNGEEHNLRERRNKKDITIRLQQFFDHYLKGEPMPEWMKKGIPAIRKGEEFGY